MNLGGGEIILILFLLAIASVGVLGVAGLVYLIVRFATNRPASGLPEVLSGAAFEQQQQRDREHLKLLGIFHFLFGGLAFLGIVFLCIHYAFLHTVFSKPDIWRDQKQGLPPGAFFDAFIWLYVFMGAIFIAAAVMNILSGIFLLQKRNRLCSQIIAGLDCLQIPFGTALGIFTLLVLSRDSVRRLYANPQ